jgi:hypothetical protein
MDQVGMWRKEVKVGICKLLTIILVEVYNIKLIRAFKSQLYVPVALPGEMVNYPKAKSQTVHFDHLMFWFTFW